MAASVTARRSPETAAPAWAQAGHYRAVVDTLASGPADGGVIGVVSPHRGDGRSGVAAGLALAMAQEMGPGVLLLDLDLERSSQAGRFGIDPHPGLDDSLGSPRPLETVARRVGPGLAVAPAGVGGAEAALGLLQRVAEAGLIDRCRREYRWTVVDLPPLESPGVERVVAEMGEYVLVGRYRATRLDALGRAAALLSRAPIGCVLTAHATPTPPWITLLARERHSRRR